MEKKVDRRVIKTRRQLKKGLAALMKEKSVNQITVKELVEEVDINRSTFYLHFKDIQDLLREIEREYGSADQKSDRRASDRIRQ